MQPANVSQYRALLEKLADLEHQQWMEWAKNLMRNETLSPARIERWGGLMVPYAQLPEQNKEQDRKWARRIIKEVLASEAADFADKAGKELARLLQEL